uniref:Acyl carrier protein n=1 Tax=Spumella elongata TaxID=89044 RepID=A0A7S3MBQ9_9STRA|mmetsp:Transcript_45001/g.78578  ORF Transcript_45001/g.78578 Transcript_45001/m.78578 type:complete len:123 (+) Transcript_45001:58-426(+)
MARALSVSLLLAAALLLRSTCFVGPSTQLRGAAGRRTVAVARSAEATAETMGKVADIIAEQLGVDKAKVIRTATLSELGADSLDIVETVMAMEEGFDVELPDEETMALKNVGDVMDLIQSKL